MKRLNLVVSLILLAPAPARAQDGRPMHQGMQCFFGTMHAHCRLSGDFQPVISRPELRTLLRDNFSAGFALPHGPIAAWTHAAERAKIDFLALTDHLRPSGNPDGDVSMPEAGYELLR